MADMPTEVEVRVAEAVRYVRSRCAAAPDIAIICGSGLGGLADVIEDPVVLSYEDIPHFHVSSVAGHAGKLVFGTISGKAVVAMKGRFHYYEGYSPEDVAMPMRVFAALGARAVLVTNAAGGISSSLNVGDVLVIRDHLYMPGLAGNHSLVGHNAGLFGGRFVPMQGTYRDALAEQAEALAAASGLTVHRGVYACVSGPTFESPAEARALRALGADVVGMSTAPEVAVAAHCGLAVVALSLVTNRVAMAPAFGASKALALVSDKAGVPSHAEVLEAVEGSKAGLQRFAQALVAEMDTASLPVPAAAAHDWDAVAARGVDTAAAGAAVAPAAPTGGPGLVAVTVAAAAGVVAGVVLSRALGLGRE